MIKVSSPNYLSRTPYSFCFRMRVPKDLHPIIAKKELRYSLRTGNLSSANRTPTTKEMKEGEAVLKALINSINFKEIIALGNKADTTLKKMGIKAEKVRHPAMGGADKFREQLTQIIKR